MFATFYVYFVYDFYTNTREWLDDITDWCGMELHHVGIESWLKPAQLVGVRTPQGRSVVRPYFS